MRIDANKYRRTLETHRSSFLDDRAEPHQRITMIALASEVPIIVVALFALRPDVLGESAKIRELVEIFTKFYGYTEVTSWTDEPADLPALP